MERITSWTTRFLSYAGLFAIQYSSHKSLHCLWRSSKPLNLYARGFYGQKMLMPLKKALIAWENLCCLKSTRSQLPRCIHLEQSCSWEATVELMQEKRTNCRWYGYIVIMGDRILWGNKPGWFRGPWRPINISKKLVIINKMWWI